MGDEEFREQLKESICSVIDKGILSEEELGVIITVCRKATTRAEADLMERALIQRIEDATGGRIQ